jgi:predicted HNH restriction endonuclease
MDAEELKRKKKDFRKYLRTAENYRSVILDSLMEAAEKDLPVSIRGLFNPNFESLFDSNISVKELISIFLKMHQKGMGGKKAYINQKCLNHYISYYCTIHDLDKDALFSEIIAQEAKEQAEFWEGMEKPSASVRYERNEEARNKCLEHYGYRCQVCGIDMEDKYGMYGRNFIEVHYIVPISKQGGTYRLDPIKDLRPLCPNCHAIIHRTGKQGSANIMTVDEFKEYYLLKNNERFVCQDFRQN